MSRLSALKEFTFMKALRENGFAVPEPVAWNRHTVVMGLVEGVPLRQVRDMVSWEARKLYAELMEMIVGLGAVGLIHGDFNEFNIMIKEEERGVEEGEPVTRVGAEEESREPTVKLIPVLIDFPQMVSVDHANAQMYFDRDVGCVKQFFERRFHFTSDEPGPFFTDVKKQVGNKKEQRLDIQVEASGFSRKMSRELERYMEEVGVDGEGGNGLSPRVIEESEEDDAFSITDDGNMDIIPADVPTSPEPVVGSIGREELGKEMCSVGNLSIREDQSPDLVVNT